MPKDPKKPKPKLWRCVHCDKRFDRSPWTSLQQARHDPRPKFMHSCGDPPVRRMPHTGKYKRGYNRSYPVKSKNFELTAFGKLLNKRKQEARIEKAQEAIANKQ